MDDLDYVIKQMRSKVAEPPRCTEQSRQEALAKRHIDDLVDEFNLRLNAPMTDENMDRIEEIGDAIKAKRADLGTRLDDAERQIKKLKSYLTIIGAIAIWQVFISAYGREAVVAWLPLLLGLFFVGNAVVQTRAYFRRRALKREIFGVG